MTHCRTLKPLVDFWLLLRSQCLQFPSDDFEDDLGHLTSYQDVSSRLYTVASLWLDSIIFPNKSCISRPNSAYKSVCVAKFKVAIYRFCLILT
ncbi:hypothetical protein P879_07156 [Paragonimus westermani]|uniref:Uncharacterized protein n=1 Tax=Paragonimus westermani TaxID=34504 RepID=A0A8T0DI51_9TREM|nr:hypothetical protein P879_07156 [Paragonimus westermani]